LICLNFFCKKTNIFKNLDDICVKVFLFVAEVKILSYNISSVYASKVNEVKSRINGRISAINNKIDGNFKMVFDNAVENKTIEEKNTKASSGSSIFKTTNTVNFKNVSYGETAFDDIIKSKAEKYSVDENLIKAVIKAESGFNPNAVSPASAQGLMQLMPATAAGLGVTNSFDPEQNIEGGVKYLKGLMDRFGGNVKLALAAYNCGPGRVERLKLTNLNDPAQLAKLPKETQNYVTKICG